MGVQFDSNYPTLTVYADFPAPVGTIDITEFCVTIDTFDGATNAEQAPRFDADAIIVLENWDGRFTRDNTSGPYASGVVSFVRRGVPIRIESSWSATGYENWYGKALSWEGDWTGEADIEGFDSLTVLTCEGLYGALAAWPGSLTDPPVGAGELAGARVDRILTAAGFAGATDLALGSVPMNATDLTGDAISQILDVVDAEGGAFYFLPDGTAVFEDRASLVVNARSNTSQVTFSQSSVFFRDATPVSGDDRIVNEVLMSGVDEFGDEISVTVSDSSSQAVYGVLGYQRTGLETASELHLQAAAEFNLARWKEAQSFVSSLTIDPAQSPTLMWPHALGRRIHDRCTVTAYNARSAQTVSRDAFIIGIRHSIAQNAWSTTFFFADATAWSGFSAHVWDTGVWDTAKWFY